ncbi:MAG: iron ABC transporter permease, partial [Pseudomonadota bacterium]
MQEATRDVDAAPAARAQSRTADRAPDQASGQASGPAPGRTSRRLRSRAGAGGAAWTARLGWALAALCALPAASVFVTAILGDWALWRTLADTVLPRYALTTLRITALVALGTALIGVGAAVLVTSFRFPGRRVFEVALVAPLAFPAYVLAYGYTWFLDHPGPVQTLLRDVTGWGPRDYWFPEIRSEGGAALMLTLVLYPYVYLLTRAALLHQSVAAAHVARTLGCGPWGVLFRVTLPMVRPAIAAGVALALMETVADFGTVAHFGVQTFATGVYRAWFSMGDRVAAAQIAACLLSLALLLAALERWQRGAAKRHEAGRRVEALEERTLRGLRGWAATAACAVPVLFGFVGPVLVLGEMAIETGPGVRWPRYWEFTANTLSLGAVAAALCVFAALAIAYASRLAPGPGSRAAELAASMGYAAPGGVIAVGLLIPLAGFDNALDAFARERFGVSTGLLLTGSAAALVLAYMARFMAAALGAVASGFEAAPPNLDASGRVLGLGVWGVVRRIHLPILKGSLLTSGLIVFVDVVKELPATLMLRPFNFDTLAVQAYRLASDERLEQSAFPSLAIAAVGLIPVTLLARSIRR